MLASVNSKQPCYKKWCFFFLNIFLFVHFLNCLAYQLLDSTAKHSKKMLVVQHADGAFISLNTNGGCSIFRIIRRYFF